MSYEMNQSEDLMVFLREFDEIDLNRYTCFAAQFFDQCMRQGAMAKSVSSLARYSS